MATFLNHLLTRSITYSIVYGFWRGLRLAPTLRDLLYFYIELFCAINYDELTNPSYSLELEQQS